MMLTIIAAAFMLWVVIGGIVAIVVGPIIKSRASEVTMPAPEMAGTAPHVL